MYIYAKEALAVYRFSYTELIVDPGSPRATAAATPSGIGEVLLVAGAHAELRVAWSQSSGWNVNPKIVQEMLAYANISETMDTYSHVLPGTGDAAAEAMDEALG